MSGDPTATFVAARAAAGVLLRDDAGRVLLVEPSYKDYLDLPGGYVTIDETPRAAAAREVLEELAIAPPVGRLLVADWRHDNPDGIGGAKILFVFDGGRLHPRLHDRIVPDGREVTGYSFHAPERLAAVTVERLAQRIGHALAALHNGTTCYLEDGRLIEADTATRTTSSSNASADGGPRL